MIIRIFVAVILGFAIVMGGRFWILGKQSQRMEPPAAGLVDGHLYFCSDKPNCVSSESLKSDGQHSIEPLHYQGAKEDFRSRLLNALQKFPGAKILVQEDRYIHAEFRSRIFGFVDDVEFFIPENNPGVVHVRSASRVGHSDLGVNRERVEAIRAALR